MTTDKILAALAGLLITITLGLASWSLKLSIDMNTQLAVLQESMKLRHESVDDDLLTLADDTEEMTRVLEAMSKHWKIHSWTKDQINELRVKLDLPLKGWPDF